MKPKKDLVRVVKAPDSKDESGKVLEKGAVSLDLTGRKPGRGVYVCRSIECLKAARKAKKFERAFSGPGAPVKIPDEVYQKMEEEIGADG